MINLTTGSMFSGIGLLDYGLHLAGLQHAWFAERDEYRRGVLAKRWPGRLVLDDVRDVRADTVERVDLVVGGFPCKGVSSAGKGNGFDHPETVLWREMRRAVGELRPSYVIVENVAQLRTIKRGEVFAEVLGDLAALGFDAWWDCLPAAAFGAPHLRVAGGALGDEAADGRRAYADHEPVGARPSWLSPAERGIAVGWDKYELAVRRWEQIHGPAPEPLVRRVDDGRTSRLERSRLSALGDGVLVQAGWLAGCWILNHAAQRAAELARAA